MSTTPRRRDARQNRERLLEVAARLFAEDGLDVAPAAVAAQAGVGVGTLYRHFPTRELLVDAAYRHRLTRVCDTASELLDGRSGAQATRAWTRHFLDYVRAKTGMSDALAAVVLSGADPFADSRALLTAAVAGLLEAGARDGSLRADLPPDDVLLLMAGLAHAAGQTSEEQAGRLVDLVMDALTAGVPVGSERPADR